MKTLRFALQIALGIAIPLALQVWLRRRLAPAQRAFAWNGATWGGALYAFGPLSLLGWFWVTRRALPLNRLGRGVAAIGLGAGTAILVFLAIAGIDRVVAAVLGLPP